MWIPTSLPDWPKPRRCLYVSVPIRMDDGTIKTFDGFRVHHNTTLGPAKGGVRFHPEVNLAETAALSMLMTLKNSLVRLPLGGGKGGIRCDPTKLSRREKQSLTRRYTSEIFYVHWSRQGHSGSRYRNRSANHGLDDGYLQRPIRLSGSGGRYRKAHRDWGFPR